jgi:exodeoxyribonuclease-5
MIQEEFAKQFISKLDFIPTQEQSNIIQDLSDFVLDIEMQEIFLLRGYAGTGKTSLINGLVQALNTYKIRSVLLAPTGRAAKVITQYTHKAAYTIHKKIYRQKSSKDAMGKFVLGDNLHKNTLFIVDEASMISNKGIGKTSVFGSGLLLDDLIRFVFSGERCKLILIGDEAQLPPVGSVLSPALSKEKLIQYMYPVYSGKLTEVIRQQKLQGILVNATAIRQWQKEEKFEIQIQTKTFQDVIPITGTELIEEISSCYDNEGIEQTIVICRSNKRANRFNMGIRNQVLYREEQLSVGDLIMIVKNNYFWTEDEEEIDFIANGDIAEITHIFDHEEMYGFSFINVSIRLIDYNDLELNVKLLTNTLSTETPSLSTEENKKLFYTILEDYKELKTKKTQYQKVKSNPYFNALQIKYAYAITCHKAQGGQWQNVFIDQGYITDEMIDKEYLKWLYTAFTRAINKLYLVNFNKKQLDLDDN